ncbi:MAG: glycosyltransferase family 2 protein [Eubacterium sp.]|nr:glycosyltransferase family 2 protein [Eubacterium sp.]
MKISGGIVTYNNERTIDKCLKTVLEFTKDKGYEFELYVYDNASTDSTLEIIESYPEVKLIKGKDNIGFGKGHNEIIKKVSSDYHFVINPDIYLDMDTIGVLVDYLDRMGHEVGLVTPKILNNDGTEQYLPKYCPTIRYVIISKFPGFHFLRDRYTRKKESFTEPESIEFCTGCFFGASTKYLKMLKGFSKRYFMYLEDTDLSRRVREDGRKIIFYPAATAHHNWQRDNTGSMKGIMRFLKSLVIYFNKWGWEF